MTESENTAPVTIKGVCLDAGGRVLLCRSHRGEWELPGGRPRLGESFATCLVREIAEETGLAATVLRSADRAVGSIGRATSRTRSARRRRAFRSGVWGHLRWRRG